MEVHHHSHTARKKWTHYFWEFLMLFLAVFCGFLAEYQLEHKIEKDREKQFLRSLTNDIGADIDQLEQLIERRKKKQQALDSTMLLLNLVSTKINGSDLYFNAIHTGRRIDIAFIPNDGTFHQLKYAGGLRLIRKRKVVDSIMKYDVSVRNLVSLGQVETRVIDEYRAIAGKVFNPYVFDMMMDENNISTPPPGNPSLLTYEKTVLDQLSSALYVIKVLNKGQIRDFNKLLQQARSLITTIKEEYNLK
jgi:hypothetical protein